MAWRIEAYLISEHLHEPTWEPVRIRTEGGTKRTFPTEREASQIMRSLQGTQPHATFRLVQVQA